MTKVACGVVVTVLLATAAGSVSAEPAAQTREFSAQSRPHIVIRPRQTSPGPDAKRYCHAWLAQEYRASGPVIVPQMRCWWR